MKKILIFAGVIVAAVAIGVGYFLFTLQPINPTPVEEQEVEVQQEEVNVKPVHTAYGTITKIDANTLTISVELEDESKNFSFVFGANTEFYSFGYANDDDLVGTKTQLTKGDLEVGDTVAVYAAEELGSVSSQKLTQVIKLN